MAVVVLVVGLLAQWGLFNSSLLSASRLPRVMAQDGWLPRVLARTDKRETPQLALAILALLACGLAALSFEKLVLVDVLLYSGVLATELAVVVKLRRAGAREGAFRVPGGAMGLAACIVSIGVCWLLLVAALAHEGALRAAGVELFVLATLVAAGLLLPRPIPENGTNRPESRSGRGFP